MTTLSVITEEDRQKRQAEFDQEEIARLKRMDSHGMGAIILQAKFGEDVDYSSADAGEEPRR